MSLIIGRYSITYNNGCKQTKDLISGDTYTDIIKPLYSEQYKWEIKGKKYEHEVAKIGRKIAALVGSDFFTDNSPLFKAYSTGWLTLPNTQGGTKPCTLIKLNI